MAKSWRHFTKRCTPKQWPPKSTTCRSLSRQKTTESKHSKTTLTRWSLKLTTSSNTHDDPTFESVAYQTPAKVRIRPRRCWPSSTENSAWPLRCYLSTWRGATVSDVRSTASTVCFTSECTVVYRARTALKDFNQQHRDTQLYMFSSSTETSCQTQAPTDRTL